MKTEIRKILADKTETLEDGRVVIVPDFSQLDDLVDDLDTLFSLHSVVKPLIDKKVLSFDDYLKKFYIENGFNYQSKRTGKIVDIDEPKKRYDWYCKYN